MLSNMHAGQGWGSLRETALVPISVLTADRGYSLPVIRFLSPCRLPPRVGVLTP